MDRLRAHGLLVGLPVAVGLLGVLEAVVVLDGPSGLAALVALAAAVPLLLRYRYPAVAAIASTAGILLQVAVGVDLSQVIVPVVILGVGAFGLGARLPLRRAVPAALVLVGLIWTSEWLEIGIQGSDPTFAFVLTFGALSMGRLLQTRHVALEAAAAAEREVAVAQERTRIARELHDLIAHTVSVMVVQAAAAEQVLLRDPARAQQALAEVQRCGRDALSETARLLDLLREGPDEAAPQPGLADLPALVQASPLQVDLHVEQPLATLPAGAAVSVCRIVQESLTNVLKHSASPRARVCVVGAQDGVLVRVEDPGPARSSLRLPGGHGLLGMSERVEVYGGRLTAGPAGPGWRVEALIPTQERP